MPPFIHAYLPAFHRQVLLVLLDSSLCSVPAFLIHLRHWQGKCYLFVLNERSETRHGCALVVAGESFTTGVSLAEAGKAGPCMRKWKYLHSQADMGHPPFFVCEQSFDNMDGSSRKFWVSVPLMQDGILKAFGNASV